MVRRVRATTMIVQPASRPFACRKTWRDSPHDRLCLDIGRDDRSGADHGRMPDVEARADENPRGDPAFIGDPDRGADERERYVAVVMRAGAQMGFLRNDGMRADRDL